MVNRLEEWPAEFAAKRADEQARAGVEFKTSARRLRGHVTRLRPDYVLLGGESAVIAETALLGNPVIDRSKIRKFPSDLDIALYGGYSASDTQEQATALLKKHFPTINKRGRVVYVDDFADSGEKLRRVEFMLGQLGFSEVKVAALVANPDPYYFKFIEEQGLFYASKEPVLYNEVSLLARSIGWAVRDIGSDKSTREQKGVAQTHLNENLKLLTRLAR